MSTPAAHAITAAPYMVSDTYTLDKQGEEEQNAVDDKQFVLLKADVTVIAITTTFTDRQQV